MLGAEKCRDGHTSHVSEYIDDEPAFAVVCRVICDDSKAPAFEHVPVRTHTIQPGLDRAVTVRQHNKQNDD